MVVFAAQRGPYCGLVPGCSCWHEERELQRGDGLPPSLLTRHAQEIPRDIFFLLGYSRSFQHWEPPCSSPGPRFPKEPASRQR